MRTLAATILLSTLIACCGCGKSDENRSMALPGDPEKDLGQIEWTITETASGKTLGQGKRSIKQKEVEAFRIQGDMGQYKIPLSDGFYLGIASSPDDNIGFGLTGEYSLVPSFSWEWFQVQGSTATKLQESGQLKVDFEGGRISRLEFMTDVSLRVVPMDEAANPLDPKWRILIKQGSNLTIPR